MKSLWTWRMLSLLRVNCDGNGRSVMHFINLTRKNANISAAWLITASGTRRRVRYDGARNDVPSRSKWLHGRNPSRCLSIAARGAVMHINENIFNNLPKCTTYSSEGEVRVAASTHTALEARKRGGVKREEKHYTLHDTAKLHYFSGTRTSLPRSLDQPRFRRCAALHASNPVAWSCLKVAPRIS